MVRSSYGGVVSSAVTRVEAAYLDERGWPVPAVGTERRVARLLAGWHVVAPVLQHQVGRYRLDFAWPEWRVALEVDGWHHDRPEQLIRDAQRQRRLARDGWLVLHVDPDAESAPDLVSAIARFLNAQG